MNEYSGLMFCSFDWFDLLAVQGTLTPQSESLISLALILLYGPTLISVHDYWKNHSFDYIDFCLQSDVSAYSCVLVTQSCLTLCNPMNCSLPGSSVHGIPRLSEAPWEAP